MSIERCADCKKPVSSEAFYCPHCGADGPRERRFQRSNVRNIILIGLGFIAVFLAITAIIEFTHPAHEPIEQPPNHKMAQPTLPVPEDLH
jgi:hypothetical protein